MISYKVYGRRWIMLLLFSVCTFLGSTFQMTFASFEHEAEQFYQKTNKAWQIDLMSTIYMAIYVPSTYIGAYVMKTYGLGTIMRIGSVFLLLSGWLRYIPNFLPISSEPQFWLTFIGQSLGGFIQPCIGLNSISLLASTWFGENERAIATSLGTLANLLGNGVIFALGPLMVSLIGIPNLLLVTAIVATFASTFTMFFVEDQPPSPPSSVFDVNSESQSFLSDLLECLKSIHYLLLVLGYGIAYASFIAFTTLANEILLPIGYTSDQAGYLTAILLGAGILGAVVAGIVLDRVRRYVMLIRINVTIVFATTVWCFYSLNYEKKNFVQLSTALGLMGFFLIGTTPIVLESAVEVTYPIPAGTSTGIINSFGTLLGIIMIFSMEALKDKEYPYMMKNAVLLTFISFWVAGILLICFNGRYLRMEKEKILGKTVFVN